MGRNPKSLADNRGDTAGRGSLLMHPTLSPTSHTGISGKWTVRCKQAVATTRHHSQPNVADLLGWRG
jgi:hypothetical protein